MASDDSQTTKTPSVSILFENPFAAEAAFLHGSPASIRHLLTPGPTNKLIMHWPSRTACDVQPGRRQRSHEGHHENDGDVLAAASQRADAIPVTCVGMDVGRPRSPWPVRRGPVSGWGRGGWLEPSFRPLVGMPRAFWRHRGVGTGEREDKDSAGAKQIPVGARPVSLPTQPSRGGTR
jgi:hypothetical protein